MIINEIEIETPCGLMNTFITRPDENGPFPVVLFLMDAPGKREELHDMASRVATSGYYVMLPNLYYRRTRNFVFEPTPLGREKMLEQITDKYDLPDKSKALRCLLDYAEEKESDWDDMFATIRCNRCG